MDNDQNQKDNRDNVIVHEHHLFVHGTDEFFDKKTKRYIGVTIKLILATLAAIGIISLVALVLVIVSMLR